MIFDYMYRVKNNQGP